MRIIKSGNNVKSKVKRIIRCYECRCEFEIQSGDEKNFKLVNDFRDGNYYEVPCPECGKKQAVDADLFN